MCADRDGLFKLFFSSLQVLVLACDGAAQLVRPGGIDMVELSSHPGRFVGTAAYDPRGLAVELAQIRQRLWVAGIELDCLLKF
jgi:hypothetical protein